MIHTNLPTADDMQLLARLCPQLSARDLPLRFSYGGQTVRGMTDAFKCVCHKERISSEIVRTTWSGIDKNGLEIRAQLTKYRDFPVYEWCFFFTNRSRKNSLHIKKPTIAVQFDGQHPTLEHSNGDNCRKSGYSVVTDPVNEQITLAPENGRSCFGAFPYMRLDFDSYGLDLAIGWPAQWEAVFTPNETGVSLRVSQQSFNAYLKPGESIRTPRLTVLCFTGDDSRGRNLWRRWYLRHILPREKNGEGMRPRLFAHTYRINDMDEFTGITEDNQLRAINEYDRREAKPDAWWIDAGWYPCDGEWTTTGTWKADKQRMPAGLGPIGKLCKEKGMDLLLWFEPERCKKDTLLYKEHPEWLLNLTDAEGNEDNNYLVNYADPDCLAYMTDLLDKRIKAYGVTIFRQDFNFTYTVPLQYWLQHEEEGRTGMLENLHTQGLLQLWDSLLERNPGLLIDSCASGGTRNDLDIMRRSVPLQYTDVGLRNHVLKQKQYRLMFEWIPYFRSHVMNGDNAEGGYEPESNKPMDEFAYHSAMVPAMTTMLEYNDPEPLFELTRKMVPIWRKAATMQLSGDYYPLSECNNDPKDWYAVQFDCPEKHEGYIQIIRNTQAAQPRFNIRPKVRPGRKYRLVNAVTGETVMLTSSQLEKGLQFYLERRSAELWFYRHERQSEEE
ncbi:MAG: alpha-galactosidase [Clostridia bacterium]|nr:alpha-galactosidase [Clostridia bacterium]